MTAAEAIQQFEEAVAAGEVANLRTGDLDSISPSTVGPILSSVKAALRHASQMSDLGSINYDAYARDLDVYARADARERGLADESGHAARCRRFVLTLNGGAARRRRRSGVDAVPVSWQEHYARLRAYELERGARARSAGHLTLLAQTCATNGVVDPAEIPNANLLKDWLDRAEVSRAKAANALSSFRKLREISGEEDSALPNIDRCPIRHERGLRGLPDIVDRLEAKGYRGGISSIGVDEVIRLLAPKIHGQMTSYIEDQRGSHAAQWPKKVRGMVSRVLAELIRMRSEFDQELNLEELHASRLLLWKTVVEEAIDDQALDGEEWMMEYLDDSGSAETSATREMYLFRLLGARMAIASAENSPLSPSGDAGGDTDEAPFFTTVVQEDLRLLCAFAVHAGKDTIFARRPELQEEVETDVKAYRKQMRKLNTSIHLEGRKRKEKLLDLVTFPMVVCVGLPWLRDRVWAMRRDWEASILRHDGDVEHPAVRRRERKYDRWLTKYLIFAVVTSDGLRIQNYAGARLGRLGDDRKISTTAPCGTPVRSFRHVLPTFGAEGSLEAVRTNFYGADHKRVKLKVGKRGHDGDWRSRPHYLRKSVVDHRLLFDYIARVRPKRLAQQGLIESEEEYDLDRDIAGRGFALFVSTAPSSIPYLAVTGGYSSTRLSEIYGEMLHLICTEALGRDLPPFGSAALTSDYRSLFSAHVSRLLAATYLHGVRERLVETRTLIDDTAAVIERRYSVVEATMIHKVGWEAPNFFDPLFDRIWDQEEILSLADIPTEDVPGDSLPPALVSS